MKKRVVVRIGMLIFLMVGVFNGTQCAQELTCSEGYSVKDKELCIRTCLAPLKQAHEAIQLRLRELDKLLKSEVWHEKLIEEVFVMYQSLERALDIFPLMYRDGLRELEKAYRKDVKLSAVVAEYVDLYQKTPLTHANHAIEMLKEAHQLFRDIRAFLQYRHNVLVPDDINKLSFYQDVSLPEFGGLEAYLRRTAKELREPVQKLGLIAQAPKQVSFAASVTTKVSEEKKEQEIAAETENMREAFKKLGEQNEELFKLARHIEILLEKKRFTEEDLELLLQFYKKFYSILVIQHPEVKKQIDSESVSFFQNAGLYVARRAFLSDYERFHRSFLKQLEQFHSQGLAELASLQHVFNSSNESVRAYLARQEGLGLTALLRRIGFSSNTFDSEESLQKLVQLLFWTTSSRVVQDAVRKKAYALLEQIQSVVPSDSISWVIETTRIFWMWQEKLHDQALKDIALTNLIQLRADIQTFHTPFVQFKDQLCTSIDRLTEGATI